MNWRVSQLDRFTLVSNSDAHSPPMLGREACAFATDLDYFAMRRALETGEGYGGTVEFFPEEGKYHLDGHRACGVRLEPAETRRLEGRCPACGKPLTVGVMHRVEELADRPEDAAPARTDPLPLPRAAAGGARRSSRTSAPSRKAVEAAVSQLVGRLGPEIDILERLPLEDVARAGGGLLARGAHPAAGRQGPPGGGVRRRVRGDPAVRAGRDPRRGRWWRRCSRPWSSGAALPLDGVPPSRPSPPRPSSPVPSRPPSPGEEGERPETDPGGVRARLDPEQRAAAEIVDGPLLIVAGPGTGKTRTLTHRLAHLIAERGAAPERCLAVTFSRRAAAEMEERLAALLPDGAGRPARRDLPRPRLDDPRRAGGSGRPRSGLPDGHPDGAGGDRRAISSLSLPRGRSGFWRGWGRSAAGGERRTSPRSSQDGSPPTRRPWKLGTCSISTTFSSGRWRCCGRGRTSRNRTGSASAGSRSTSIRISTPSSTPWSGSWRRRARNLFAIGDPDQSIYGFRGADVGFFLRFREDLAGGPRRPPHPQLPLDADPGGGGLPGDPAREPGAGAAAGGGADRQRPSGSSIQRAATERAEAELVVQTLERLLGGTSYFSFDSGRVGVGGDAGSLVPRRGHPLPHRGSDAAAGGGARPRGHPVPEALPPSARRAAGSEGADSRAADSRRGGEPGRGASRPDRRGAHRRGRRARPLGAPRRGRSAPAARHPCRGGSRSLSGRDRPRRRGRHLGPAGRRGVAAHPARLERAGVSGGLPGRLRGRPAAVLFFFRRRGAADAAEERRLFFVGITRACSRLFLFHSRRRSSRGEAAETRPSPFLADLEEALLDRPDEPVLTPRRPEQLRLL